MVRSWMVTVGFVAAVMMCVYQRMQISRITRELSSSCSVRTKRSLTISNDDEDNDDDRQRNSVYFPVYAQISKKAMRKLCDEQRRPMKSKKGRKREKKREKEEEEEERRDGKENSKEGVRKKCSLEADFSPPRLVARRPHFSGCALRDGRSWFICEYHMGYTLLEFADTPSLSASLPRALRTLPYPYEGTDAAALNGSVAYAHDDQLVLFNLTNSMTHRLPLTVAQESLYNDSLSRISVQSDEHGLWVLYRIPSDDALTVSRVAVPALNVVSTWRVASVKPRSLCSAFIRCGILYTLTCASNSATLRPAYDFYSAVDIVGREITLTGISAVSSAQYDATSHTLSIFSRGSILSLDVKGTR